ncbi:MAG: polysaccharide biosynthesis protein [Thalassobium sp.]|nr:MAG: polysaccharide biosynthesis protein [Thalassobium sp.]
MSKIKKLASQTAVYGLSSIVGRSLNYLLTPLYTSTFSTDQYGIITEMYAYVAFLIVILTYGMETACFRFATLPGMDKKKVFSTATVSLFVTTLLFLGMATMFSEPIANWLQYPNHQEYIIWFALIIGLDAMSAIPMAKLRANDQALRFAMVNLVSVAVNIGLNLFFLVYCKMQYDPDTPHALIDAVYNPEIGVGYVFISNLIASAVKFVMLLPEMLYGRFGFDIKLWKPMLKFAYPLIFVGIAGIINETLDRIMLKDILITQQMDAGMNAQDANHYAMSQLGIYGACYKLAILISMFVQAYRYAAEPFFFNQEKEKGSKKLYAKIMTYLVIVVSLFFLGIMLNLHLVKYFIPNPAYWEGLKVVPILLMAYVFYAIYVNSAFWYKLAQKTHYGTIISAVGAALTIGINYAFIPTYGYMACAWATLIAYVTMSVISYFLGQKHYPIPYNLKKIGLYIGMVLLFYAISIKFDANGSMSWLGYLYHWSLIATFVAVVFALERPQKILTSNDTE